MKIAEIKQAEAGLKGFCVTGKVAAIYKSKLIEGVKNDKKYSFVATGIKLEDDTDWIYVNFSNKGNQPIENVEAEFKQLEGETITCISCSIHDYVKDGVEQRSLRANEYSTDVILQEEDPAHPELPEKTVIEDKEPLKHAAEMKEPEKAGVWEAKDLRIVRQNSNLHATTLVIKYFKGSLEEAIDKTKQVSNMLVDSVYQDLDYPIKNETEKTQAKLLDNMKKETDKNVSEAELDALDKKALDCKKQLFTLTGDDIEYGEILGKFEVSQPYELDMEQKAELVTCLAQEVIRLQKGE